MYLIELADNIEKYLLIDKSVPIEEWWISWIQLIIIHMEYYLFSINNKLSQKGNNRNTNNKYKYEYIYRPT